MAVIDSFKANTTSVEFSWPADLSGLERIILSAHGDLQRLLSAFFSHSINIKTIFAHTSPRTHEASPEQPITQRREVHLVCNGRTACIATSNVTITTPQIERLFLDEKFAIGQMFRKLQTSPEFALLECGSNVEAGKRVLWRRYTLSMEGFVCDIVEVFPDRDMFVQGQKWLSEEQVSSQERNVEESKRRYATGTVLLAA
jgi:chorismate-pyruvate lyase